MRLQINQRLDCPDPPFNAENSDSKKHTRQVVLLDLHRFEGHALPCWACQNYVLEGPCRHLNEDARHLISDLLRQGWFCLFQLVRELLFPNLDIPPKLGSFYKILLMATK